MGRKPNTETRRQQIIDALLLEMAELGYERASTKSIAARAGLAPGLVHYHFHNKQEILLELVDQLIQQAERRFSEAIQEGSTAMERLNAFVASRVGLGPKSDNTQVKAWVSIIADAMAQPEIRSRVAKWLASDFGRLSALFEEAGSGEPAERASALLAMILGSFSLHAIQVRGIPKGYAERQILQWLASTTAARD